MRKPVMPTGSPRVRPVKKGDLELRNTADLDYWLLSKFCPWRKQDFWRKISPLGFVINFELFVKIFCWPRAIFVESRCQIMGRSAIPADRDSLTGYVTWGTWLYDRNFTCPGELKFHPGSFRESPP